MNELGMNESDSQVADFSRSTQPDLPESTSRPVLIPSVGEIKSASNWFDFHGSKGCKMMLATFCFWNLSRRDKDLCDSWLLI